MRSVCCYIKQLIAEQGVYYFKKKTIIAFLKIYVNLSVNLYIVPGFLYKLKKTLREWGKAACFAIRN